MNAPFDTKAAKKACNVSINEDLLRQAKALGINLSQVLEEEVARRVREAKAAEWRVENRAAIDAYTSHFEKHGVWSDGLRSF